MAGQTTNRYFSPPRDISWAARTKDLQFGHTTSIWRGQTKKDKDQIDINSMIAIDIKG
jgi:hypothetical protein